MHDCRTKYVAILWMSLWTLSVHGQDIIDTWWTTGQTCYTIPIAQDGVYRIDASTLRAQGIPDQVKMGQLRIYHNGQEISLYTSTADRIIEGDYLLFYGEANDGTHDAELYVDAKDQLNPYYSLFTDTSVYYLTWTAETSNARYRQAENIYSTAATDAIYHIHHEEKIYHDHHQKPVYNGRDFIRYSDYGPGEGFGALPSHETVLHLPVIDPSDIGPAPRLRLRFGTNVHGGAWQIIVNGQLLTSAFQGGYGVIDIEEKLPYDLLGIDTLEVIIRSANSLDAKHILVYHDLSYPQRYDELTGSYAEYNTHPSILSRRVELPAPQITTPLVLNTTTSEYIIPDIVDGVLRYGSDYSLSRDKIVMLDATIGPRPIDQMSIYTYDTLPKSMGYLIISQGELMEAARAYGDYRASEAGGEYDVEIIDMDDLYHHYSHGLQEHPLAISHYLQSLDRQPSYIYIIGKGIEYKDVRESHVSSHVPTYGIPGSDRLLIQNAEKSTVGRLAARSPQEVMDYLEKIKLHESPLSLDQTIADQSWKKGIIHLSGGSTDIQNLLYGYLNNMGDVLSHNTFGGHVQTFRKTSSDPIQTARSAEIISAIDEGAAVLSFFGHSAVGTFDFSLEDPAKYSNKGRNPVILSMGCYSGNLHTPRVGISESFVLTPDVGATHFMASSGTAYINPQYRMGMLLYELMGDELYGQPIGKIVQEVISRSSDSDDIAIKTLLQQWTLHGDPAYSMRVFDGPDYLVDDHVSISPQLINSTTEDITLTLDVMNIGRHRDTPLDLQVIHAYADDTRRDTYDIVMPAPAFDEQVTLDIPHPGEAAAGINHIYVHVDPDDLIAEYPQASAEENNQLRTGAQLGYSFYVIDNVASPTYPSDFGIVTSTYDFELRASTNNAFAYGGTYDLQIDTTETFSSPLLRSEQISPTSSELTWRPDIDLIDGRVYYWRIAPVDDQLDTEISRWQSKSFIYLEGDREGYSQSHYYQWLHDDFDQLYVDESSRDLAFAERPWDIRIKNKLNDPNDFWVYVNNSPWRSLNPKDLAPGIQVFAWDRDQIIVPNSGRDYGSMRYSPDGFVFQTETPQQRHGIVQLLHDLPDGAQVFFHTILDDEQSDLHLSKWSGDSALFGESLIEVLKSIGAQQIDAWVGRGSVPYTLIYEKGKGVIVESLAERIDETIDVSSVATTVWDHGSVKSTLIGPVDRYLRLQWAETKSGADETELVIHGITPTGQSEVIRTITDDYDVNLTSILPSRYPYIQLEYRSRDPEHSSAQLDYWRVQHSVLSDAILYTSDERPYVETDTIHAGEDLQLQYQIKNDGDTPFDAMLVRYKYITSEGDRVIIRRTKAIPAGSTVDISESLPTGDLSGDVQLVVEINPNAEQPELLMTNNFGTTRLYVIPDQSQPFVDVLVDGTHPTAQYVSDGRPDILISLSDPASQALLNDPEDVEIRLYYPEFLSRKVKHDSPDVVYLPATNPSDNVARYVFRPKLDIPGVYTLEVKAKDRAGNSAGTEPYRVQFSVSEVVRETQMSIAPVPFAEQTRLRYTYRGQRLPQVFYINIYSADGLLVRHLTGDDFGGLFYGKNDYIWNGTNDAGVDVPNGIYYYEVVNSNDQSDKKIRGSIIRMR